MRGGGGQGQGVRGQDTAARWNAVTDASVASQRQHHHHACSQVAARVCFKPHAHASLSSDCASCSTQRRHGTPQPPSRPHARDSPQNGRIATLPQRTRTHQTAASSPAAATAQLLCSSACSLQNRSASPSTTPDCGERAKEARELMAENSCCTASGCCIANCATCRCSTLANSSGSSLRPTAGQAAAAAGTGRAVLLAATDLRGARCSGAGSP